LVDDSDLNFIHLTIESLPKKLLEQAREILRIKHYSYRTEEFYLAWMRQYILFHNKRHPKEMGSIEIEAFLSHLAVNEEVAASTQNQALCALLFLYRHVLKLESPLTFDAVKAKRS
jgi:metal-responsive CopG/Arc/MetJ family transcriptional regulator